MVDATLLKGSAYNMLYYRQVTPKPRPYWNLTNQLLAPQIGSLVVYEADNVKLQSIPENIRL